MRQNFKPQIIAIELSSYPQRGLSEHGLSDTTEVKTECLGSMATDCIPWMKLAFHDQRSLAKENHNKTFQLI